MFRRSDSGNTRLPSSAVSNKVNLKRNLSEPSKSNWLKKFSSESVNKIARLDGKDMGDRIQQHRRKMASVPAFAEGDEIDFPQSFTQKRSQDWQITASDKNYSSTCDNSVDCQGAMSLSVGEGALRSQPSTCSKDLEAELAAAIGAIKFFHDSVTRGSPLRHVTGPLVVLPTIPEASENCADNCAQMECSSPEGSQYTAPLTVWGSQFRQGSSFSSFQEPLRGGLRRISRNFEALNVISDQDNCIL